MYGLIIGVEPIEQILDLLKTWEMRGKYTHIRGRIALIKKGTKTVVGFADLVDVLGPLSLNALRKNKRKHLPTPYEYKNGLGYKQTFAWVLKNVERLPEPIPYQHPSGAVIWVILPDSLLKQPKQRSGARQLKQLRHSELKDAEVRALIKARQIRMAGYSPLKIYGRLDCTSGKRMQRKNRVFFACQKDAVDQQYRPCGHCMPAEYKEWKKKRIVVRPQA